MAVAWLRTGMGWVWRGTLGALAIGAACLAYSWVTLPDVRSLRTENPTSTAFMRLRADEARDAGHAWHPVQHWVPLSRMAPILRRAVIITEDAAFWDHDGVDYAELRAAVETKLKKGGVLRGGSTITQQLAKNLYLSPSRNPYRKLVELMITRRLEAELSKQRILELYLNLIEWGDGIWGADAAARSYFGKSASDLSPDQAALLAGAIINPRIYTPRKPNGRLLRRQQIVLRRLGQTTTPGKPLPPKIDESEEAAVEAAP